MQSQARLSSSIHAVIRKNPRKPPADTAAWFGIIDNLHKIAKAGKEWLDYFSPTRDSCNFAHGSHSLRSQISSGVSN